MLYICENYANDYNILFNGKKSQLLLFKGKGCTDKMGSLKIFGETLKYCNNAVHLGHSISNDDSDFIVKKSCSAFWKSFNIFISDFGHIHPVIQCQLFDKYCCSFYGSPIWLLHGSAVDKLCIAWRKALRMIWKVHPMTHCDIIHALSGFDPLKLQLTRRFIKFVKKCLLSDNEVVRIVSKVALYNPMSVICCNYRDISFTYGDIMSNSITYSNNVDTNNYYDISVLEELINIRDGYMSCEYLSSDDVNDLILQLCTK